MLFLYGLRMAWMLLLLEQMFLSFCFSNLNNTFAKRVKSKTIKQPSTNKYVVVFDIDYTLCRHPFLGELDLVRKYYPECPVIYWNSKIGTFRADAHVFLLFLEILFEYLLENGVRIAFFSSAMKERNEFVISELLTSFWGHKEFKALKSEGQFSVFSREHLRKGNYTLGQGEYVKDLRVVIQDGESLMDAILVEDDPSFTVYDQRPCMQIMDLGRWHPTSNDFPMNSIYYMLGLFRTYFEHNEYKQLPLREGLRAILGPNPPKYLEDFKFENHFARNMIETGLIEVQKQLPNAKCFGLKDPWYIRRY